MKKPAHVPDILQSLKIIILSPEHGCLLLRGSEDYSVSQGKFVEHSFENFCDRDTSINWYDQGT